MKHWLRKIFKPRLKLEKGTRLTSFLFIATSFAIATAVLFAANVYYNLDTGEVILEHIQRVTQVVRATAGLIVGGGPTQNPSSGYVFEVVGSSKLATTTIASGILEVNSGFIHGANQEHLRIGVIDNRFEVVKGGSTYEVCDTSGNCVGQGVGLGGSGGPGQVAFWTGSTTLSGSNDLFWATSTSRLGIGTNSPQYTLDVRGPIRTGATGTAGQLIITNSSGYNLVFQATTTMNQNLTFNWPANYGANTYVLTTDGAGNLYWSSVGGVGAVTGSGNQNRVAKWTVDGSTLGNAAILDTATAVVLTLTNSTTTISNNLTVSGTGIHSFAGILDPNQVDAFTLIGNITGSGSPNITGIGNISAVTAVLSDSVTSPLYTSTGALTIRSGSGGNIILDPATGIVQLESGDYIRTFGGFEIGKAGTQILREMAPIMGFDLPVKTATSSYVQISRDIESYPLGSCQSGTSRVHKLVIRYAAKGNGTLRIGTNTYTLPQTGNDLSKGTVRTVDVTIPTPSGSCTTWTQGTDTTDWFVELNPGGNEFMIYQIFLAGYDQIQ